MTTPSPSLGCARSPESTPSSPVSSPSLSPVLMDSTSSRPTPSSYSKPKRRKLCPALDKLPEQIPMVRYQSGMSEEEYEKHLQEVSQGILGGVDDKKSEGEIKALASMTSSQNWQSHWKLMLRIFGCSPWDLQTWGLRLGVRNWDTTVRLLNQLLPHPIWEGNAAILRHVLQMAVSYRWRYDLDPLGPLPSEIADVIITRRTHQSELETSNMAFAMWSVTSPKNNDNIAELLREMRKRILGPNDPLEKRFAQLYTILPTDVSQVQEALDGLSNDRLVPFTVQQYYGAFMKNESWPGDLALLQADTIGGWDRVNLSIKKRDKRWAKPDTCVGRERERHTILAPWKSSDCSVRNHAVVCIIDPCLYLPILGDGVVFTSK